MTMTMNVNKLCQNVWSKEITPRHLSRILLLSILRRTLLLSILSRSSCELSLRCPGRNSGGCVGIDAGCDLSDGNEGDKT